MKYAFIHKNLRELGLEKLVIFGAHCVTIIACFLPWFVAAPSYDEVFWYSGFRGPGFLIGIFIFLISVGVVITFIDQILGKNRLKLPFKHNYLYFAAGVQQVILIILAWSVLLATGDNYANHSIRFGIHIAFVAQICGLVATFLNYQLEQQKAAQSFFQHPSVPKTDPPHEQ